VLHLIDGYNVTHADPATLSLPAEQARDALVARLSARGRDVLGPGRIVVVFDGPDSGGVSSASHGAVEVRYSRGEEADDVIVRMASAASGQVTVVTSDRGLVERVCAAKESGVRVLGRERVFESAPTPRAKRGHTRYPGRAVGLPPGANRITEELKGVWLSEEDEE